MALKKAIYGTVQVGGEKKRGGLALTCAGFAFCLSRWVGSCWNGVFVLSSQRQPSADCSWDPGERQPDPGCSRATGAFLLIPATAMADPSIKVLASLCYLCNAIGKAFISVIHA